MPHTRNCTRPPAVEAGARGCHPQFTRPVLAACLAVLAMAANVSAATWTGGNFMWSQPDADSFDVPYNPGDAVVFGGAGTGGTVAVAAGGVTPGSIAIREGSHTFKIAENNALGAAPITFDYGRRVTFSNTVGEAVALANTFIQPNGGNNLVFAGGDFRLTGPVHGGINSGANLMPAAGVTLTLEQGVAGAGDFSIAPEAAGATVRILGVSGAGLVRLQGKSVTLEIGADNALGPRGRETVTGGAVTLVAYGGSRAIDNGIYSRGFNVAGAHDLTINGPIRNQEGYIVTKTGPSTLTLNGDNVAWGNTICLREGVIRAGHTNALGTTRLLFAGGVLELEAADFARPLSLAAAPNSTTVAWDADGVGGVGGGFSACGGRFAVNLGGARAQVAWGVGGFVPADQTLVFGSTSADAPLDFQNPIDLGGNGLQGIQPAVQTFVFGSKSPGAQFDFPPPVRGDGAVRTICVHDNPQSDSDRAELSGILSGGADMGLDKIGNGTLFFNAVNTHTGNITVRAGSIGGSGRLAGNLFLKTGSGFVVDMRVARGPFVVAGVVDIGAATTLTVLGKPRTDTRLAVVQALGGMTGRFARVVGLAEGWTVDYTVAGEVAIVPHRRGL